MRHPINFINDSGHQTTDFVDGIPIISLDIDVSFKPPTVPNGEIRVHLTRVIGIVDTGSNATMVSQRLLQGRAGVRDVEAVHMAGVGTTSVHVAAIGIPKLLRPKLFEVGCIPLKSPLDVLIGRDILSRFKLVFDTPRREFYLEGVAIA